jgi:aryl-alcohol dehydrogenase-like predicted oxidoreductase
MKFRVLGRTGLKVSELGVGGHEFPRILEEGRRMGVEEPPRLEERLETQGPRNELVKRAVEEGVNFFDTGQIDEPQSLGLALKALGRTDGIHVAAETLWPFRRLDEISKHGWREFLIGDIEKRLKLVGTERIDVFNVHEVENGYSRDKLEFVLSVLSEMKDQGKIGAIGASTHQVRFLAEVMRRFDCFDSVMVPYNYHHQEAIEALFPLCRLLNVGVVVMKAFCWPYYGISFHHFCPPNLDTGGWMSNQVSLRWILQSPEVGVVVPAMSAIAELEDNVGAITKEGRADEEVLRRCLETARTPSGQEKLKELLGLEEIASTRTYIRDYIRGLGFAKRALERGELFQS